MTGAGLGTREGSQLGLLEGTELSGWDGGGSIISMSLLSALLFLLDCCPLPDAPGVAHQFKASRLCCDLIALA